MNFKTPLILCAFDLWIESLLASKDKAFSSEPNHEQFGSIVAPPRSLQPSFPIEPSSDILLASVRSKESVLLDNFVSRNELGLLYRQYVKAVDPLAHVVHKPIFDRQFCQLLLKFGLLGTDSASFTALVLTICFAAAVSFPYLQC